LNDGTNDIATYTYDNQAAQNQSITRDPDLTGSFVLHSQAKNSGGALFSPGTKLDSTTPPPTPTPGITITQSDNITEVAEGSETDSYTVVLDSKPTAEVTINISTTEETTTNLNTLTFTTDNWNTAQTVTITAVDDSDVENNHSDTVSHTVSSNDTDYNNFNVDSVNVNIIDNDSSPTPTPGITITQSDNTTEVAEGSETDSYTVVLDSKPTAEVTINISTTGETTTDSNTLTFTTENWNTAQTITITAVDDTEVENNHSDTVSHTVSSNDTNYNNIAADSITVNIRPLAKVFCVKKIMCSKF